MSTFILDWFIYIFTWVFSSYFSEFHRQLTQHTIPGMLFSSHSFCFRHLHISLGYYTFSFCLFGFITVLTTYFKEGLYLILWILHQTYSSFLRVEYFLLFLVYGTQYAAHSPHSSWEAFSSSHEFCFSVHIFLHRHIFCFNSFRRQLKMLLFLSFFQIFFPFRLTS